MIYCILISVLCGIKLADAETAVGNQATFDDLGMRKGMNSVDVDFVKNLVKKELDKHWHTLAADFQKQISAQENRIKYLENRDKRMKNVVNELMIKMLKSERRRSSSNIRRPVIHQRTNDTVNIEYGNIQDNINTKQRNDHTYNTSQNNSAVRVNHTNNASQDNLRKRMTDSNRHLTVAPFTTTKKRSASIGIGFTAEYDPVTQADTTINGQTIKMRKVLLNDGNCYNKDTGIFTAPISGVYMFTLHIGKTSIFPVDLVLNGVEVVHAGSPTDNRYMGPVSGNTAIIRVEAGQNLWLKIEVGGNYQISSYISLSGVFLY